jgi:hypothetical protein
LKLTRESDGIRIDSLIVKIWLEVYIWLQQGQI